MDGWSESEKIVVAIHAALRFPGCRWLGIPGITKAECDLGKE